MMSDLPYVASELYRLACVVDELGRDGPAVQVPAQQSQVRQSIPTAPSRAMGASMRAIVRTRRQRDDHFPSELFADPAWDMLLDLAAAHHEGQRVSVSSLCIASAVPPTTALRWIRMLVERGIFARIEDPSDGRRVFIELTEEGVRAFERWWAAIGRRGFTA